MGFGDTSKKDKAATKAAASAEASRQAEEDAGWDEGGKKANKKKEADAERAAAKAARKAETDDLLAQEEAESSKPKEKKKGKDKPKLTRAEIAARAMAAAKEKEKEDKQRKTEIEKSGGNEYIGVLKANDNKSGDVDASGIDAAIGALDVGSSPEPGKGKNLKALFAAFEEQEIARLKVRYLARARARSLAFVGMP
jgi:hypothetical protein